MKLTMLRSTCANGRTCPTIYATDRDSLIIQGYEVLRDPPLKLVEIPSWLLPEAVGWPGVEATGRGTLIMAGTPLDGEAREALGQVPAGEGAVEVGSGTLVEV